MANAKPTFNEQIRNIVNHIEENANTNNCILQDMKHTSMEGVYAFMKEYATSQTFTTHNLIVERNIIDSAYYQIQYEERLFHDGSAEAMIIKVIKYDWNNQDKETLTTYTII